MKNLSKLFVIICCVGTVLLTSCFKDNEYKWNDYRYVTVESNMGVNYLVVDHTGEVLLPSAASWVKFFELKSMRRAYIQFEMEWSNMDSDGSGGIPIELLAVDEVPLKEFCQEPDTLHNDSIASFNAMWAYNGYVTVQYRANYDEKHLPYPDVVQERIGSDTLYLRFNVNNNKGEYITPLLHQCFEVPSRSSLVSQGIQMKKDSIVVRMAASVASGTNGKKTEYIHWKYKPI